MRVNVLQHKQDGRGRKIADLPQALPRCRKFLFRDAQRGGRRFKHFRAAGVHDPAVNVASSESMLGQERVHIFAEVPQHGVGNFR